MDENYGSRAIYSNAPTKLLPYILLLVAAKSLKAFGLYLTYDLLKVINVVQFLFIVKTGATALLILLQKPIGNGPKLSKNQWFKVARFALCETCVQLLWLFGLTLCGPLRSILLYEHSDIVLIAALTAIFTSSSGGTAKARGAAFFVIAILGILFFDHDDFDQHKEDYHPEGRHSGIISHTFYHFIALSGLSDHKGGVVLLCATLCLQVGYNSSTKLLSVTMGGAKRLHALTTLVSAILLAPWAGFIYWTSPEQVTSMSWTDLGIQLVLVILLVFVLDYYVVSVSMSRLDGPKTSTIGAFVLIVAGLLLSVFWNHPYMQTLKKGALKEDHVLSGGVIFSCVLFMFATRILSSPNKGNRGTFIGYSAAGQPLYNVSSDLLHSTTSSAMSVIHSGLRQILEERESRQIFYFLCINLVFTFVELVYGAWTNSLGLISDGFHMLFDCSALVMGLYAAIMSRWKATRTFSYGYDRVEILSGFINGLFLVVIAFFVFTAAISRIFDPPKIHTERLLVVSVLGLLVNLIGIFAFSHGHSHGGMSHGHSHDIESHSHNHHHAEARDNSHGHSHDSHSHKKQEHRSSNMQGVFLHVLADTLGSVGVIISTLLIENFGWNISDPICSIFISTLIFLSVLPLLKETSAGLLLRSPVQLETDIAKIFTKFVSMDEILSFQNYRFWQHSSKSNCGSIHLQVAPSASEQKVTAKVTACFKEIGINNITLQVEKEPYFQHMSGLQASNKQPVFNRKYATKSGSEDTVKVV